MEETQAERDWRERRLKTLNIQMEDIVDSLPYFQSSKEGRRGLSSSSLLAFCMIYLNEYFYLGMSDDQLLLLDALENEEYSEGICGTIGSRGSGKSTIAMTAYLLWSIVTKRYMFNVLVKEDEPVMKVAIKNIKTEIENNKLLIADFDLTIQKKDSFQKKKINEKWTDSQLNVNGVLLLGRTIGQNVRGLQYRAENGRIYRPQNIVCDDLENPERMRSKQFRRKLVRYFYGELVPAGDIEGSKIVMVANLSHRDSLVLNMRKAGEHIILMPILRDGKPANPYMFPTMEDIERKKKDVMRDPEQGRLIWLREYELKIISEDDQILSQEDFSYYDSEMWDNSTTMQVVTGMDLAISQKETADFTAMITAFLRKFSIEYEPDRDRRKRVFVTPDFLHKRMTFAETITKAVQRFKKLPIGNKFLVENNAYQQVAIETLKAHGVRTDGVRAVKDKRAKLETIAPYIKDGTILFHPDCQQIIEQIIDFGIAEHDDLIDALVYAVTTLVLKKNRTLAIVAR